MMSIKAYIILCKYQLAHFWFRCQTVTCHICCFLCLNACAHTAATAAAYHFVVLQVATTNFSFYIVFNYRFTASRNSWGEGTGV